MPGMAPQIAPNTVEASRHTHHGACSSSANTSPPNAPSVYCPAAPMLKRPVLNAKATERPHMMSGAAVTISLPMPEGIM